MGDINLQALCQLLNSACNNADVSFFCTLNHLLKGRKRQLLGPIILGALAKTRHYGAHYAKYAHYWCILCEAFSETREISGA